MRMFTVLMTLSPTMQIAMCSTSVGSWCSQWDVWGAGSSEAKVSGGVWGLAFGRMLRDYF
jgi:hypothetical protein